MQSHIKGFVVAAMTPVIVACIVAVGFAEATSKTPAAAGGAAMVATGLFTVPIAIAIVLLIGIPAYCLATRFQLTSLRFYLLGGVLISLLPAAFITADIYFGRPPNEAQAMLNYLILATSLLSGPHATVAFWFVVRPDQIRPAAPIQGP